MPAHGIRIAAITAGTLGVLLGPVAASHVLVDDGGGTVSAGVQAAGDPAPPPVPAPVGRAAGPPGPDDSGTVTSAPRPAPLGVAGDVAPSPPVHVAIPALGVSSDIEDLVLGADGRLVPPRDFARAGWFADGIEPGQPGPAVIAGHVDSQAGPAVFHRLDELAPGDDVVVGRADGSTLTFRVTERGVHSKAEFPTEDMYGPATGPELRLITCTGPFDDGTGHYLENLVVYATLT